MSRFLKTVPYARSVLRQAILTAGQFAHVPEDEVDAFLDDPLVRARCCQRYRVSRWHLDGLEIGWLPVWFANEALQKLAERHKTLCPVCFCPIDGTERRYRVKCSGSGLMPSWLDYYHDDNPFGEPEQRGEAHHDCGSGLRVIDSDSMEWMAHFLKRSNYRCEGFWKTLRRRTRERPKLRFYPGDPGPLVSSFVDVRHGLEETDWAEVEWQGKDYYTQVVSALMPSRPATVAVD